MPKKQPRKKRRRLNEKVAAKEVGHFAGQRSSRRIRFPKQAPAPDESNLNIIIDDDKIVKILEFGIWFNERMFLIQRLNDECAWIPTKVANIKYPDEVMEFYEKHIDWSNAHETTEVCEQSFLN